MDGTVKLRRLAAVKKPRTTQTDPARYFVGGVSADQTLGSYFWSYIQLAAAVSRWQNLANSRAIAVVLSLLSRTILPSETRRKYSDMSVLRPRVVQMVTSLNLF